MEDSRAATAEAEMSQTAGDVGDWLGIDSGAPAPVQVTLVPGKACPAQPRGCRCLGSQAPLLGLCLPIHLSSESGACLVSDVWLLRQRVLVWSS